MGDYKGPVIGLSVEIERGGEIPLHEQIEGAIRDGIRSGRLAPGGRLPSTRALAAELGISRGVVTEAYSQLAAEGYLHTRQGAPVQIARGVRPARTRQPARPLHEGFAYDFHPGRPDLAGFPRDRWLRSLRRAWREAPIDAVGYPDPRGVPELRQSLADYLGRACGAAADPEQLMICTGFSQALSMICRWLAERGVGSVAVEDPGWHRHRLIVDQAGIEVLPVRVDREGLQVEALRRSGASAVVVTAAHQFPTGRALSGPRRAALIEWAEEGERLIVEDDFDSEYRYDRQGLGALQGLAPERVAYIGSASKRLIPGMRLGWALLPSWLSWPLLPVKAIEDGGSEVIGQLALHDFIEHGELDRHLRRTRLRYQRRREALGEALARWLPEARFGDGAAGLFELVDLPDGVGEPELVTAAAERGVGVEGLGLHRSRAEGPPGLVLGFGGLAEPAIEHGVRLLSEAAARSAGSISVPDS
jgi:GntR family transcriptional regulator/MocR family aminotransferase